MTLTERGAPHSLALMESGKLLPGVNVIIANPARNRENDIRVFQLNSIIFEYIIALMTFSVVQGDKSTRGP